MVTHSPFDPILVRTSHEKHACGYVLPTRISRWIVLVHRKNKKKKIFLLLLRTSSRITSTRPHSVSCWGLAANRSPTTLVRYSTDVSIVPQSQEAPSHTIASLSHLRTWLDAILRVLQLISLVEIIYSLATMRLTSVRITVAAHNYLQLRFVTNTKHSAT